MEEPGRLQTMGSLESDTTEPLHFHFSLFTFMHWRRKWQPTPVFLPGESQGRGSLVGCRLWGHTESDTTKATQQQQHTNRKVYFPRSYKLKTVTSWLYPFLFLSSRIIYFALVMMLTLTKIFY